MSYDGGPMPAWIDAWLAAQREQERQRGAPPTEQEVAALLMMLAESRPTMSESEGQDQLELLPSMRMGYRPRFVLARAKMFDCRHLTRPQHPLAARSPRATRSRARHSATPRPGLHRLFPRR